MNSNTLTLGKKHLNGFSCGNLFHSTSKRNWTGKNGQDYTCYILHSISEFWDLSSTSGDSCLMTNHWPWPSTSFIPLEQLLLNWSMSDYKVFTVSQTTCCLWIKSMMSNREILFGSWLVWLLCICTPSSQTHLKHLFNDALKRTKAQNN